MKFFLTIIVFLLLSNCSFDNKTGIWQNSNDIKLEKNDQFKDFKKINTAATLFNEIIQPNKDVKIILDPVKLNLSWVDEFYQNSNTLNNFSFKDTNELIFKSKKLSKNKIKKRFLFHDQKVFLTDAKGNIIIYSIENQKIIFKYNFYKKKYKKITKVLNIILEKDIIYISDNLGYLYALDYINQKLIWAQNYKIPFRSNLKVLKDKLYVADTNNSLYLIYKRNGEKIRIIPTEETLIKNDFINSLALNKDFLFFLNTYGSLYSVDKNGKIKWFINLNQSLNINPNSLFYSHPILLHKDKIIISTDSNLYVINSNNGSIVFKLSINSWVKPIISGSNMFLITKENLLVYVNLEIGKIIYSIDVNQKIADFLDVKANFADIKSLAIVNSDLYLFLNNSYLVKFATNGKIKNIIKLSSRPNSYPIFINDSIIYLDNKNKLIITN